MNKYKITISNKNLYKEIQLPNDVEIYKVGTSLECDYRLYKEQFFDDIRLEFINADGQWSLICSDNLFITSGESRRVLNTPLKHADIYTIKYQESNNDVFNISFAIDFDDKRVDYNRRIFLNNIASVSIGATSDCQIQLMSEYITKDKIILNKSKEGYLLNIVFVSYDVKHNGNQAVQNEFIADGDFISLADFSFYVTSNSIWLEKNEKCRIMGLNFEDYATRNNYPKFIRNTRVKHILDTSEIEILDPPSKPQKPKSNLLMSLLPSFGMLLSAGIMAYMGGTTMIIFSGISAGMAIVTTVLGIVQGKKEYKENIQKRIEEYSKYIAEKRNTINQLRKEELDNLNNIYISREQIRRCFGEFSSDLFDRESTDSDFLHVCLGRGDVEAQRKIKYKKQEKLEIEDELQVLPEKICNEFRVIHDAPVVCNYRTSNAIGIIGDMNFKYEMLKSNVMDICARQFYTDVKIFFIMSEENRKITEKFRLLPYANNTIPNSRNIACDEESKKNVFEFLYNELTRRETDKKEENPHYVVFFYDLYGFASHPVSKFVKKAAELGVTFVFFATDSSNIPQGCDYLIKQKNQNIAELTDSNNITQTREFNYYRTTDEEIEYINVMLASVVAEEISLEGTLTKNIDLFKLLNILGVEDLDLKERWNSTQVYKSMSVPLGISKTGVVYLDLHDKAHGPHGLVAGTTGSGKSEILQTYILSVATYFHPYEIGFLIIDFKGGGMVNQFKNLPHLLGAITNIDGKEIDRSLKSIKAELQKRQRLFAEAEVNHIDKYIKKFKAGGVKQPLPHLIIIVDEFAELRAEQPEFMKELISAARIGRSLGVHLILATQKPSGQVDEQIWSNSRFKLCLKVQDQQDSNEVLKSPLAAEIKEPGRAYLQVGNNEIFELFQSAYSGASEKSENDKMKEFSIYSLSVSGKRKAIFTQKKQKSSKNSKSQLEAIVEYVHEYAAMNEIDKLPDICLPSLKDVILQPENINVKKGYVDIGIYDDPDNQLQDSTYIDFENRNTLIIGSSQFGKTNLLETIIKSIVLSTEPKQSVFYILDFASMALKNLENLNHVGGVITSSEDEKLKNLFKLLLGEINARKEKLLAIGVSSFASYLEAGYTDLPHIYIVIDNFTALSELYLQDDDSLLMIIREGLTLGISTIVANPQISGIGYKYISNFANKIAFYCNDTNEYLSIFDHTVIRPDEKPGRCVLELDKRMVECQTYIAFEGEKEIDRVNQMHTFISNINEKYGNERAKQIPYIPNILTENMLREACEKISEKTSVPIGLTYDEVKPFYLKLNQLGIIGICGKEGFGHKNLVTYVIDTLLGYKPVKAHIVIFDDVSRKYEEYKEKVEFYTLNADAVTDVVREWHNELERRYSQMMAENFNKDEEILIMIVQNNDVAQKIQSDMETSDKFRDIISRYKDMGVCIIFANYPNRQVAYDAPEALRVIKQNQHIICLEDLKNLKCFDAPYEAIREYKKPISLGEGYYINENDVTKIKIVCKDV